VRRLLQLVLAAGVLVAAGAAFAAALFYAVVLRDLPDIRSLQDYHPNLITRVYAADGAVIGEFYRERREIVPIERIPAFVVHAFIAIEDDSFYTHEGLDYPGIARAAWRNLVAGEVKQGGSTITQQVAKTFLLTSERTWIRKLKDMVLARRIEQHLDKNEILYLYLNQIYLGSGAYGVQAASKVYFGKSVDDLTLAEAALIAGVVPAPSRYSPFTNPELARQRQRMVLRRMREEGFIDLEQRKAADEEPWSLVQPARQPDLEAAAYFAEEVRRYLYERFGSDLVLTGGLDVRTTLDLRLQRTAWESVRAGLRAHDHRRGWRGPLRRVKKADRPAELEALASTNPAPPWPDGTLLEALVVAVDDKKGEAVLSLGTHGETVLTLEQVAWAAPPNAELDGLDRKISRISAALAPGDVVRLETRTLPEVAEGALAEGAEGATLPPVEFSLHQDPEAQGALLSFELQSGRVQALVGGYDYRDSEFDRALQSKRQPGSAFKPIVYAAALERGYTPARIVLDTPVVYDDPATGATWKPENYTEEFYGPITMREALAQSRNIATIRILQDIGLPPVLDLAQSLGIARALGNNLSLALGTSEVTLAELVRAFAIFGAGGRWVEPIFIVEVRDRSGEVLERAVPLVRRADPSGAEGAGSAPADTLTLEDVLERQRARDGEDGRATLPEGYVLDPVTAYLITDMMKAVIEEGTGRRARAIGRPLAGKTGTTNDLYDAWFVGFSPHVVTGAWVGYDNVRSLGKNETGARAALPIWIDYMREAVQRHPPSDFADPPGVVFARIDRKTGLLAAPGADGYVFQAFREGTEPTEFATTANANGSITRPRLD
jgi:penicillin-binding protein 1A